MIAGGVVGIGIDIIDNDRFRLMYEREDDELLLRCFDPTELVATGNGPDRFDRLAARFAAKEAVYKALGGSPSITHTEIIIFNKDNGAPTVELIGEAKMVAEKIGVRTILISLTHSALSAAAMAIALASASDR